MVNGRLLLVKPGNYFYPKRRPDLVFLKLKLIQSAKILLIITKSFKTYLDNILSSMSN